jgi:hypothetical protein
VILALVFVVACQQAPVPEPKPKIMCPDGQIVDDAALCALPEPIETCDDGILNQDETNIDCGGICGGFWYNNMCNDVPAPIPPTPEVNEPAPADEGLGENIIALFAKAEKYNNFKYKYRGEPNPTQIYNTVVWKTKMKITLPDTEKTDFGVPYDTVYLDTAEKTAVGYCEWDNRLQCNSVSAVTLEYTDFNFKTPYQWTKEIKSGTSTGSEQIFGRNALRVSFKYEGKNSLMWIDEFYGLPIKIVVGLDDRGLEIEDTVTYSYQDLQVNAVFEEDVTPPA